MKKINLLQQAIAVLLLTATFSFTGYAQTEDTPDDNDTPVDIWTDLQQSDVIKKPFENVSLINRDNNISLKFNSNSNSNNIKMEIFDVTGKLIHKENINTNSNKVSRNFNLNIANGIYILRMNNNKDTFSQKFYL